VSTPNVNDDTHARKVVGCSDRGVPLARHLHHELMKDRRVIGVLCQVGKEGRAVHEIKGGLASLHTVEQMAPRIPHPGRPPIHRHRPERARDIGAEQGRWRGQGKALLCVLREHVTTGQHAQYAVQRGRMGPCGRRQGVEGLWAIRQEVRNTQLGHHIQHRRKYEAVDHLLHGSPRRLIGYFLLMVPSHRGPLGPGLVRWAHMDFLSTLSQVL
jgi:hypothetical protein